MNCKICERVMTAYAMPHTGDIVYICRLCDAVLEEDGTEVDNQPRLDYIHRVIGR